MFSWPGHVTPQRRDAYASSVDLAPTILRACGAAVPAAMSGVDLLATDVRRDAVFGALFSHDVADLDQPTKGLQARYVVRDGWKLIAPQGEGRRAELFDLGADPHERADVAAEEPQRAASLRQVLDAWWRLEG